MIMKNWKRMTTSPTIRAQDADSTSDFTVVLTKSQKKKLRQAKAKVHNTRSKVGQIKSAP